MERKEKLIEALVDERHRLICRGVDIKDSNLAIQYLMSGVVPKDIDINNYNLLYASVCDFETLCNDYDV